MGEKRVKTFYDITARRWNDIINAVNRSLLTASITLDM